MSMNPNISDSEDEDEYITSQQIPRISNHFDDIDSFWKQATPRKSNSFSPHPIQKITPPKSDTLNFYLEKLKSQMPKSPIYVGSSTDTTPTPSEPPKKILNSTETYLTPLKSNQHSDSSYYNSDYADYSSDSVIFTSTPIIEDKIALSLNSNLSEKTEISPVPDDISQNEPNDEHQQSPIRKIHKIVNQKKTILTELSPSPVRYSPEQLIPPKQVKEVSWSNKRPNDLFSKLKKNSINSSSNDEISTTTNNVIEFNTTDIIEPSDEEIQSTNSGIENSENFQPVLSPQKSKKGSKIKKTKKGKKNTEKEDESKQKPVLAKHDQSPTVINSKRNESNSINKKSQPDQNAIDQKPKNKQSKQIENDQIKQKRKSKEKQLNSESKSKKTKSKETKLNSESQSKETKSKQTKLNSESQSKEKQLNSESKSKETKLKSETKSKEKQLNSEKKSKETKLKSETKSKEKKLNSEKKSKSRSIKYDFSLNSDDENAEKDISDLIQIRGETQIGNSNDDDLPIALRRSKRVIVKPLKHWKGERIVYGLSDDNLLSFETIAFADKQLKKNEFRVKPTRMKEINPTSYDKKIIHVSGDGTVVFADTAFKFKNTKEVLVEKGKECAVVCNSDTVPLVYKIIKV